MSPSDLQIIRLVSDTRAAHLMTPCAGEHLTVESLNAWESKLRNGFGAVGVLELSTSLQPIQIRKRIECAHRISHTLNNYSLIIAVTDIEFAQFYKELLISGFASVFCSQSEKKRLQETLTKHAARIIIPELPLEQEIMAQLPWQGVTGL